MDFCSDLIAQLTEPASLALVKQIQVQPMMTPLQSAAIATAYVCLGKAHQRTPFLLLSGFDSSLLEFRRLLPLLADSRPTWSIDLLGFGFTERPTRLNFSPAAIKTHLYHCWQTLINQPVILVGASMGGAAAIDFALTYPAAVQKLVLIDSAGFNPGPAAGKFLFPPLGWLATSFLRSPKVRQNISLNAYHDPGWASPDAQICAALHLEAPGWRQALISFTRSGGYGSFRARLAELRSPTLIVWGESDRILGTADAEPFQQSIPNSKLVWIPKCGHVPHLECPQATATAILDWLEE
jgi:pimeloyl-ACP methyl ester carboxylesterase